MHRTLDDTITVHFMSASLTVVVFWSNRASPSQHVTAAELFLWPARRSGTLSRTICGIRLKPDSFRSLLKTFFLLLFSRVINGIRRATTTRSTNARFSYLLIFLGKKQLQLTRSIIKLHIKFTLNYWKNMLIKTTQNSTGYIKINITEFTKLYIAGHQRQQHCHIKYID